MCGIIGYIGHRRAAPILVDGLARMEYRGYDSAGVVVLGEGSAQLFKTKGRVEALRERMGQKPIEGLVGIAHTRWATHGQPNDRNAHPHADCKNELFLVHNGIIENHETLREMLRDEGHVFASETDTEVLSHLIEKYYSGDLAAAVKQALTQVRGTYGVLVAAKHSHGLVAACLGSPLIVGVGDGEYVAASDLTAILPITQRVVYLQDGEMTVWEKDHMSVFDISHVAKKVELEHVEWTAEAAQKSGFEHFMLKEIFEQPEALRSSMRGRLIEQQGMVQLGGLRDMNEKLREIQRLVMVGMGTARNAALVGKYMVEEYADIPAEVEYASEFAYKKSPLSAHTALLAISQSGETADTLLALKEAKQKGLTTLGIVNVTGSSIARATDAGIYNHIGPEIAVASTKAFSSQVALLSLLTVYLGRQRNMSVAMGRRILQEMEKLPTYVQNILEQQDKIKQLAEKYGAHANFYFLGRKYNAPVAFEGALKLKEVAYVHAEGYNSGEMKHGPIALIEPGFPCVVLAPQDSVYEKNLNQIQEIKVRGGRVIAIGTEGDLRLASLADDVIYIPKTLEMLTPILSVTPLQLFAYYFAVARGCDVDKPRNLAKSVTVE